MALRTGAGVVPRQRNGVTANVPPRRRIAARALAAAVAAVLLLPALRASAEDMVERARAIREQLLAKRRENDEQEKRAGVLSRMAAEARQRLARLDGDIQNLERRRLAAEADSEQSISRLAHLDGVVGHERAMHRARVAGIYRAARIGAGAAGWTGADTRNVRLARYLVSTAGAGAEKVSRIEVERGSHLAALDRARGEQETAASAAASLQNERFQIEGEVVRTEAEVQAYASQKQNAAAGVAELEASARTLERELAALAPKPVAPVPAEKARPDPQALAAARAAARETVAAADPNRAVVASVPPQGDSSAGSAPAAAAAPAGEAPKTEQPAEKRPGLLSRLFRGGNEEADRFAARKGGLAPPVGGKVVASYGQQHKSGNKYRGVILRSKGGAPVRNVSEGQVIFSGSLSGMGNTVIISHGGRYHSVYARLGSLRFKEGDRVGAGDVVGSLPEDDPDLHFELRDGGQAVDPAPWVKGLQ